MNNQRLKIESKTLMSIVILEHRAIIKFCVQAGKSLMVTKRFLDATGDDQHVFIFVKPKVHNWNQRFKGEGTDFLRTQTQILHLWISFYFLI